jgi:hypothetical protein
LFRLVTIGRRDNRMDFCPMARNTISFAVGDAVRRRVRHRGWRVAIRAKLRNFRRLRARWNFLLRRGKLQKAL